MSPFLFRRVDLVRLDQAVAVEDVEQDKESNGQRDAPGECARELPAVAALAREVVRGGSETPDDRAEDHDDQQFDGIHAHLLKQATAVYLGTPHRPANFRAAL